MLPKLPESAIRHSNMNYVSRVFVLVVLLLSSILSVRGKFDPYADNGGTTVGSLMRYFSQGMRSAGISGYYAVMSHSDGNSAKDMLYWMLKRESISV